MPFSWYFWNSIAPRAQPFREEKLSVDMSPHQEKNTFLSGESYPFEIKITCESITYSVSVRNSVFGRIPAPRHIHTYQ